jgi:hypothetical protein
VGTRVKESQYIGVRRIGVLDDREHLHVGFAISDIPTVTWQCGTTRTSGVQVASYRGSGKGKSRVQEHQDSRSREFRNSDRRIKGGEVKSTRVSENRHIGVRSLEFNLLTSRVAISR